MPNCAENYENEISEGKNLNSVKCRYCNSKILNPSTGNFHNSEFQLPLIQQKKGASKTDLETETVSLFWEVGDMYTFENVGISHSVGGCRYLSCADCEVGPIGYHDLLTKKSYVALSRVLHL